MSQEQGKGRGRGRGQRPQTASESGPKEEKKEGTRGRGGRPTTAGGEQSERRGRGRGGGDRDNNDREHGGRGRGGYNARTAGNKKDGQDGNKRQQNEDQWIYKFHKESLRKTFDRKVEIAIDMDIPAMPDKEQRLREPDKAALNANLDVLEAKFKEIKAKKQKKLDERKIIMQGGRMDGTSSTVREALNELIKEQKELNREKSGFQNQMRSIKADIESLNQKARQLQKMMLPGYNTLEEIQEALAHKKHRQTTTSLSGQEEASIIKEISKLEKSIPSATELEPITPMVKELKGKQKELYGQLDTVRAKTTAKQKEIDDVKATLDEKNEEKNEKKDALDKTAEELDEMSSQMNLIYTQKETAKDEFWKAKFDYREQQDLIDYINFLTEEVDFIKNHEANKQKKIDELKSAVTTIENPKSNEIKNCKYLINVCHTLKVRSGLVEDVEAQARAAQQAADKERMQERMDKMMTEGKIENGQSKQDREKDGMIVVGGKGKQKNKGKKKEQKAVAAKVEDQYEDPFQHDITLIQKFAMVNVSPPNLPQDLDDCMEKLQNRQEELEKEGEAAQKKAMEDARKETEEQIAKLETEAPQQAERPSGGRGGRGRGNRGNDRGGRSGRGGRGGRREEVVEERENAARTHKDNREFDDSDDDNNQYYKAPARATGGNQKQSTKKQSSLKMDEDNFPTFN